MDLESLQKDVASGLYFDSDIPQGYGAGSSGALVAALYDSYGTRKPFAPDDPDTTSFQGLKSCFGRMESYFHGTSSGLDPLICFVNRPILVRDWNTIAIAEIPGENFGPNRGVFLLDAGKPGKTGPLVKEFLERCNREDFLREFRERYVTAIDRCIGHLLEGDWQGMEKALSLLSAYQLDHMVDLIPEQMRKPWKTGLGDPRFKLKLCGSGGGGFILCFASDSQGTESYFRTLDTVLIPVPLNN
jgi:mevalonate kinase